MRSGYAPAGWHPCIPSRNIDGTLNATSSEELRDNVWTHKTTPFGNHSSYPHIQRGGRELPRRRQVFFLVYRFCSKTESRKERGNQITRLWSVVGTIPTIWTGLRRSLAQIVFHSASVSSSRFILGSSARRSSNADKGARKIIAVISLKYGIHAARYRLALSV